jgi:hypothetical protein
MMALCILSLGKGPIILGKGFAECNTRQRAFGNDFVGKDVFAECLLSGTRQREETGKKIIEGGMHSQLVTHLMGCTVIFHKLSMIGFKLTTPAHKQLPLPLHHWTKCVNITFLFSTYYN